MLEAENGTPWLLCRAATMPQFSTDVIAASFLTPKSLAIYVKLLKGDNPGKTSHQPLQHEPDHNSTVIV